MRLYLAYVVLEMLPFTKNKTCTEIILAGGLYLPFTSEALVGLNRMQTLLPKPIYL